MAEDMKFKCGGCSRAYAWKVELAGKKVRCKCGHVMAVPVQMTSETDPRELDDMYELAGEREEKTARTPQTQPGGAMTCPSCRAPVAVGGIICLTCGMNFKSGKKMRTAVGGTDFPPPQLARPAVAMVAPAAAAKAMPRTLGYASRNPQQFAKETEDANATLKQLTMPIIMVVLGLGLMLTYTMLSYKDIGVPMALVVVGVSLIVNMVFITIGCLIAIKMLDISLGAPAEAFLKVCAVALLPGAVSGLIEWKFGLVGGMVGWGVALALYYALLVWFFDLDTMELLILTVIIWLVRTWIGYIVLAVILSAIMGGSAGWNTGAGPMAMFAGGGGTNQVVTDNSPVGRNNRYGESLLMRGDTQDAEEFAKANDVNNIINFDNAQTRKMISDLADAGAEEIKVSQVNTYGQRKQADKVVMTLPDDPEVQQKLVDMWKDYLKTKDCGPPINHGKDQVYLILNFDGGED